MAESRNFDIRPVGVRALALCALSTVALPGVAHASCEPVIAAYDKADATQRYALYEVDTIAQAPKGDPLFVAIGDAEYSQQYETKKGSLNMAKAGYLKVVHKPGFEGRALKDREKSGSARCEPLGERKVGSEAVVGYRIRDNRGKGPDLAAIELWVAKAGGTPVFHGMGSDNGGFRWVYGSSVVAPPMGAGK